MITFGLIRYQRILKLCPLMRHHMNLTDVADEIKPLLARRSPCLRCSKWNKLLGLPKDLWPPAPVTSTLAQYLLVRLSGQVRPAAFLLSSTLEGYQCIH